MQRVTWVARNQCDRPKTDMKPSSTEIQQAPIIVQIMDNHSTKTFDMQCKSPALYHLHDFMQSVQVARNYYFSDLLIVLCYQTQYLEGAQQAGVHVLGRLWEECEEWG